MQSQNAPFQDPTEFGKLYEHAHLSVYRFIYSLCAGPHQLVEDLTAETFWRAWKARRRFQGSTEAAVGWLLKIARRLVIDEYRRSKVRGVSVDIETFDLPANQLTPEEHCARTEQLKTLLCLIQSLPLEKQEIITLRYILGWRVKDIASHLEMNENTVSVTIRRSIQKIRASWPASPEI